MRHVEAIESERLVLRRPVVADGGRIAAFTSDLDVARMTARIPHPNPLPAAEGWVLITRAREALGRDHVFAVELKGEGLIGMIGAHQGKGAVHEVGYWFGKPFWGEGFATEALVAFMSEARLLGALKAGHFVDNPASGRVLEKAGFRYTGETISMFSLARAASVLCRRMSYDDDCTASKPARCAADA